MHSPLGLIINVYRWTLGDCTNSGVSSLYDELCVVNDVEGPAFRSDGTRAVFLHNHQPGCLRLVPAVQAGLGHWVPAPGWFMMGGNFGHTSDSRFAELCERMLGHRFYGAVAIHDRQTSARPKECVTFER